jgi:hypothetical protein
MVVIAYITEMVVVAKILCHLGLPTEPPELSPARGPAQLELWDTMEAAGPHTVQTGGSQSRGPPSRAGPDFAVVQDDFVDPLTGEPDRHHDSPPQLKPRPQDKKTRSM